MRFMPTLLEFLRSLGYGFSLDWDDELQIEWPDAIDPKEAVRQLLDCKEAVVRQLRFEGERARRQFLGGPLDGRPCRNVMPRWALVLSIKEFNLPFEGKAHWCAYFVKLDGRAIFCGMATSEKKAREMAWKSAVARSECETHSKKHGGSTT